MKSSIMKVSGLALLLIGMTSCGGGSKKNLNITIKPEETTISGDLEDYIEIVDSEYELVDDWGGKMSIKIEALEAYEDDLENFDIFLTGELLDDKGMPVSGTGDLKLSYASRDKLQKFLKKGEGELIIQLEVGFMDYKAEEHAEKVKKFNLSSSIEEKKQTRSTDSNNRTSSESSDMSSSDVDEMLDSYDDYMDSYVSLAKKMQKDPSNSEILSEYTEYMNKTADFAKKLEKCKDDMSSAQIQRMIKIQSRMASAI